MHFGLKWTKNNDSSEHLLFEKCPNNNRLSIHILIRAGGKNVEIKECKDKEIMKFTLFYFVNEENGAGIIKKMVWYMLFSFSGVRHSQV